MSSPELSAIRKLPRNGDQESQPMTQYDAAATMYATFSDTPDMTGYTEEAPQACQCPSYLSRPVCLAIRSNSSMLRLAKGLSPGAGSTLGLLFASFNMRLAVSLTSFV